MSPAQSDEDKKEELIKLLKSQFSDERDAQLDDIPNVSFSVLRFRFLCLGIDDLVLISIMRHRVRHILFYLYVFPG